MYLRCSMSNTDISLIPADVNYSIPFGFSDGHSIVEFDSIERGVQVLQELFPYASYQISIKYNNAAWVNNFTTNEYKPVYNISFPDLHYCTQEDIRIANTQHYLCRNNSYFPYDKQDILKTIDNHNPTTFLPYLQAMDYPYIQREWKNLVEAYGGRTTNILGRYIAKMRLKGFQGFGWADNSFLNRWGEQVDNHENI